MATARANRGPWVILVLSLALTALATSLVGISLRQRDETRFVNAVQAANDRIQTRLDAYVSLLRSAVALHAANDGALRRDAFRRYVERLDFQRRYPGIQGLGYAKRVTPDSRAELIAKARADGISDFDIWPDLGTGNVTTVLYLEPLDARNRAALGFDMFSEEVRREAMERAWLSGSVSMSGSVTLKQEIAGRKQAGFLLYAPVYRGGLVPASEAERRERLDGFVYSPFRADDLFFGVFGGESNPRVAFRVYDGSASPEHLLHDSALFRPSDRGARPSFHAALPLKAAGRTWTIEFENTRAFERSRLPLLVPSLGLGGLLISLVLFGLARSQAAARTRAERSERRGSFLLRLEDALRGQSAPEAIIATSARLLVEQLAVERCAYGEVEDDQDHVRQVGELARDGMQSLGRFKLSRFGADAPRLLRENRPFVVHDVARDPRLAGPVREQYSEHQIGALVLVPLHKQARFAAAMAVYSPAARPWSPDDVELIGSVASRCWESIERVRGENMLRESEARFRNMADHAPVMLWITEPGGRCTYLNRPWYEFTGQSADGDAHRDWLSAVHPDDAELTRHTFAEANQRQLPFRLEYRLRRHDGQYRWVIDTAAPRFGEHEEYLGYIGSVIEITERKQIEQEREQLLQQAEDAVRVRDDFLSIASHELKTPIAALTLQSASLGRLAHKQAPIPVEKLDQKLEAMNRQMLRLNSLVEDLLNVSRIAAGRLQVQPEHVDLSALLQEVLSRSKPMLDRAGCELDTHLPATLEACLDPMRMQQIADNLLENARKYGAGKPVEVELGLVDSQVRLVVRDHGIGIAPEDQSRIFERFERAVPSRHYGGLGLGLWITRQLVEAMGGSIRVDSLVGRGATFTVNLPRGYQA